jgi:hypothetical protein
VIRGCRLFISLAFFVVNALLPSGPPIARSVSSLSKPPNTQRRNSWKFDENVSKPPFENQYEESNNLHKCNGKNKEKGIWPRDTWILLHSAKFRFTPEENSPVVLPNIVALVEPGDRGSAAGSSRTTRRVKA